jgi:hypothetical protein
VEAAAFLRRSRSSFRKQWQARLLPQPSDRNGNRNLWDRRVLERYVDGRSGINDNGSSWDDL